MNSSMPGHGWQLVPRMASSHRLGSHWGASAAPTNTINKGLLQSRHQGHLDLDSGIKMLPKSHWGCLISSVAFVVVRFSGGVKRHGLSPAVWSAYPSAGKGNSSPAIQDYWNLSTLPLGT